MVGTDSQRFRKGRHHRREYLGLRNEYLSKIFFKYIKYLDNEKTSKNFYNFYTNRCFEKNRNRIGMKLIYRLKY